MPSISIQNKFPTFVLTPIAATKLNPAISLIEKDLIRINFVLVEWDIEGSIWTVQNTGEPKKISIKISRNE